MVVVCGGVFLGEVEAAMGSMVLDNGVMQLRLSADDAPVPSISSATRSDSDEQLFTEAFPARGLEAWVPGDLIPAEPRAGPWRRVEHPVFLQAETTRPLAHGLAMTWVVQLAREGSSFRTQVGLANTGNAPVAVEWFPGWNAMWRLQGMRTVRRWRSLSYLPVEEALTSNSEIALSSRLHSSDDITEGATYPYWVVSCEENRQIRFSLSWCGGWKATLKRDEDVLAFDMHLPPNETQLVLAPGEWVAGPIMTVTFLCGANERENRAAWMRERAELAGRVYGGPAPSYPLVYNHWYETRFGVDGDFLKRQIAAMAPYEFDAFVVDAGWYQAVGQWWPHRDKFGEGEFEAIMESVRDKGVTPGIWSCPQFVHASEEALPAEVDRPGLYRTFIDGYLLDMAGTDFTTYLLEHVRTLRARYSAGWWKYDQDFFTARTRHGVMKNVVAFQNALVAVRKSEPDLVIESCQSGGRMINDLTMLTAQTQWLRDGGASGIPHIRRNIAVGLRSLEFVFPWQAGRWTNRPNDMHPNNDEITRYLCRSAMMGTWGIVADLDKIHGAQRAIILREIKHYRRLNRLKNSCLYDLELPLDGVPVAGVTYYAADGTAAGSLLYRWGGEGALEHQLILDGLDATRRYSVTDVDAGDRWEMTGDGLHQAGPRILFPETRLSALVFVETLH
jgi:hypothetical protein